MWIGMLQHGKKIEFFLKKDFFLKMWRHVMQHECALHDANKHITTIEQKNFGKKKVEFLFQKFF